MNTAPNSGSASKLNEPLLKSRIEFDRRVYKDMKLVEVLRSRLQPLFQQIVGEMIFPVYRDKQGLS